MTTPNISIILCAFNEEKYIKETLETLVSQDIDVSYEIIVVDNCSTDKTSQIASKYTKKVVSCGVRGKIPALKAGLDFAKGNIVAIADADTLYPKNWLSTFKATFDSSNTCGFVFGGTYANSKNKLLSRALSSITDIFIVISLRFNVVCSIGFNVSIKKKQLIDILSDIEHYV